MPNDFTYFYRLQKHKDDNVKNECSIMTEKKIIITGLIPYTDKRGMHIGLTPDTISDLYPTVTDRDMSRKEITTIYKHFKSTLRSARQLPIDKYVSTVELVDDFETKDLKDSVYKQLLADKIRQYQEWFENLQTIKAQLHVEFQKCKFKQREKKECTFLAYHTGTNFVGCQYIGVFKPLNTKMNSDIERALRENKPDPDKDTLPKIVIFGVPNNKAKHITINAKTSGDPINRHVNGREELSYPHYSYYDVSNDTTIDLIPNTDKLTVAKMDGAINDLNVGIDNDIHEYINGRVEDEHVIVANTQLPIVTINLEEIHPDIDSKNILSIIIQTVIDLNMGANTNANELYEFIYESMNEYLLSSEISRTRRRSNRPRNSSRSRSSRSSSRSSSSTRAKTGSKK